MLVVVAAASRSVSVTLAVVIALFGCALLLRWLCKTHGHTGVSVAAGAAGSLKAKAFELLSPFEERGWSPFAETPPPAAAAPKPGQGRRERNGKRGPPARAVRSPRSAGWNSSHHTGGSLFSYDAAAAARSREEDEERARRKLAENQSRYDSTLMERKWHAAGGAYYKTPPPRPRPVPAAAPPSEPDAGAWFAEAQAQLLNGLASLWSPPPAAPAPGPVRSAKKERVPRPERQWLVLRVRGDRPGAEEVRVRASLAALVSDIVDAVEEDNRQRDGALPRGWVVVEPGGGDTAGDRDGSSGLVLTTRQGRQLPPGRTIGSLTIRDRELLILGPPPPPTKPLPPLKKRQQQQPAVPNGASDVKHPPVSPYSNGARAAAPMVRCSDGAMTTRAATDDDGGGVAEPRLRLQVSTMQGVRMQLDASTDDTVLELKRKVLEVLGQPDEPPYHLALLFQGNPMADRSSLRLNGVVDGDLLVGDLVRPQSSAQPAAATAPPLGSLPREPTPATPPSAQRRPPMTQDAPPAAVLPPPPPPHAPPQSASPPRQARSTPPRTAACQREHTRRPAETQRYGVAHGGASPIGKARRVAEPRPAGGGGPSRGGALPPTARGERGVDELAHDLGELARGLGGRLDQLGAGAARGSAALAGGMALHPTNLSDAPALLDAAAEQVASAAAQMEALVLKYEGELGVRRREYFA